ncbi:MULTISPECIES: hypothetical protein [Providencia]|nr:MULTISPECIES: hypothetical protein [Providencia]MCF8964639.1 hypothetical protein [Providencia rettgeri]TNV04000.1 hypothetical protein FH869_03625 [Providencia rettgeri]UDQ68593.1 hypothetical protein LHK11_06760 [Providencia rettgeri]CAB5570014.1 Uncharacterised protein [Providencia rettgeri]CAC9124080.1 Uncharacterised protein [Providencia rettgeri]
MKTVYLDQNIWLDIILSRKELNIDLIQRKFSGGEFNILYSPANCEELCNSHRSENIKNQISSSELNDRLEVISKITNNMEILPYPNRFSRVISKVSGNKSPIIVSEHPIDCFERVNKYYQSNAVAELGQKEILDKAIEIDEETKSAMGQIKTYEEILKNENSVNSLLESMSEKLKFSTALHELASEGVSIQPYTGVVECLLYRKIEKYSSLRLSQFKSRIEKIFFSKNIFMRIKKEYSLAEIFIDTMMKTLMLNGFSVEKKPMSSLHDNTHSIYGSFCDYFITRDERLAKKVKLVYDYINCPTIVLFDKENKWIELIESPTDYQNKHKLD